MVCDLLTDVLADDLVRDELVHATVSPALVGPALTGPLTKLLLDQTPEDLAATLVAGVARDEIPGAEGLVARLSRGTDLLVPPLPNLLFTRDTAVRIGRAVALAVPSMRARHREATITRAIWSHHPRLAAIPQVYDAGASLEGGDVLVLGPGVLAVGVGQRTTPAGVEALAQRCFEEGLATTVLAVPISQERATMHLDTVCTFVDTDELVVYQPVATSLEAYVVTRDDVTGPEPFLAAAAAALGIERLRVVDTGLDPVTAEREQWDDGNNTLAVAPGVVVAYERNERTNARLEAAGIEVLRIPGSELGSGRGGPRCMSCPVTRDPITPPATKDRS
jgi:arginine deiminase